ncbi:hypothetical protein Pan153_61620 [Gimesia panareensis]|uniref:HEAT repeat protein n=1 Tax=Gimesia panareensis TaxID=2527978 RepID=A0A518FYZ2_9PLAN|nr:hypothetical protein [Gimesia panareensis]QDV21474.1 hypothetical protein Pan153_61620 [Gimesia panareensis]
MLKRISPVLALVCGLTGICLDSVAAEVRKQESAPQTLTELKARTQEYEAILYKLGAFPVRRLTKPYKNNGHPGEVYFMGSRIDVHGWLPPLRAIDYLSLAERKANQLPRERLSYERYVALLDVKTYQQTRDPLLFAVLRFTLDEMRRYQLEIKEPEDLLKVYHARIGLEEAVLKVLEGRGLTGPMVADLYRQYGDPVLLRYVTPPAKGQQEYRVFLEQLLTDQRIEAALRFVVYTQLYQAGPQKHLAGYKAFIAEQIEQLPNWHDRKSMNTALSAIGDAESIEIMNRSLLNDPVAEVREWILVVEWLDRKRVHPAVIDTLLLIAEGKGKPCRHVLPTCFKIPEQGTELRPFLYDWLDWARDQPNLAQETRQKIERAVQAL